MNELTMVNKENSRNIDTADLNDFQKKWTEACQKGIKGFWQSTPFTGEVLKQQSERLKAMEKE